MTNNLKSYQKIKKYILFISLFIVAACSDDNATTDNNTLTPDQGADIAEMSTPGDASRDLHTDHDMDGEDLGSDDMPGAPDMALGSCDGIDCSGAGSCALGGAGPQCMCEAGYSARGLSCLKDPKIQGLPNMLMGSIGKSGTHGVSLIDGVGDVTWSIEETDCTIDVSITAQDNANATIIWSCGVSASQCKINIKAGGDQTGEGIASTTIECTNKPPRFVTANATMVMANTPLRYGITCIDPDPIAPLMFEIGALNECGGSLSPGLTDSETNYNFVPMASMIGSACKVEILCSDNELTSSQIITFNIIE